MMPRSTTLFLDISNAFQQIITQHLLTHNQKIECVEIRRNSSVTTPIPTAESIQAKTKETAKQTKQSAKNSKAKGRPIRQKERAKQNDQPSEEKENEQPTSIEQEAKSQVDGYSLGVMEAHEAVKSQQNPRQENIDTTNSEQYIIDKTRSSPHENGKVLPTSNVLPNAENTAPRGNRTSHSPAVTSHQTEEVARRMLTEATAIISSPHSLRETHTDPTTGRINQQLHAVYPPASSNSMSDPNPDKSSSRTTALPSLPRTSTPNRSITASSRPQNIARHATPDPSTTISKQVSTPEVQIPERSSRVNESATSEPALPAATPEKHARPQSSISSALPTEPTVQQDYIPTSSKRPSPKSDRVKERHVIKAAPAVNLSISSRTPENPQINIKSLDNEVHVSMTSIPKVQQATRDKTSSLSGSTPPREPQTNTYMSRISHSQPSDKSVEHVSRVRSSSHGSSILLDTANAREFHSSQPIDKPLPSATPRALPSISESRQNDTQAVKQSNEGRPSVLPSLMARPKLGLPTFLNSRITMSSTMHHDHKQHNTPQSAVEPVKHTSEPSRPAEASLPAQILASKTPSAVSFRESVIQSSAASNALAKPVEMAPVPETLVNLQMHFTANQPRKDQISDPSKSSVIFAPQTTLTESALKGGSLSQDRLKAAQPTKSETSSIKSSSESECKIPQLSSKLRVMLEPPRTRDSIVSGPGSSPPKAYEENSEESVEQLQADLDDLMAHLGPADEEKSNTQGEVQKLPLPIVEAPVSGIPVFVATAQSSSSNNTEQKPVSALEVKPDSFSSSAPAKENEQGKRKSLRNSSIAVQSKIPKPASGIPKLATARGPLASSLFKKAVPTLPASKDARTAAVLARKKEEEMKRVEDIKRREEERNQRALEAKKRREEEMKKKTVFKPVLPSTKREAITAKGPPLKKAKPNESTSMTVDKSDAPKEVEPLRRTATPTSIARSSLQSRVEAASFVADSPFRTLARVQSNGEVRLPSADRRSVESSDDEESAKPRPSIPRWAESPALAQTLVEQKQRDPDEIFGADMPVPNLEVIFKKSTRYRDRSSSANWAGRDRLTTTEQQAYGTLMGYKK